MDDKDKGVGIRLSSVHKQCGQSMLIDYGGIIYCDHCQDIVYDPINDILSEEEYQDFLLKKTEKYRKA